jgi:hypothetical protein
MDIDLTPPKRGRIVPNEVGMANVGAALETTSEVRDVLKFKDVLETCQTRRYDCVHARKHCP